MISKQYSGEFAFKEPLIKILNSKKLHFPKESLEEEVEKK